MKYTFSYDVRIPGIVEVEADDEDQAWDKFFDIESQVLLNQANHESADVINEQLEEEHDDGKNPEDGRDPSRPEG
jgi:hypothetical protein